ncbi:hypothetical protein ACOMHN_004567 [Nucella lapillus]
MQINEWDCSRTLAHGDRLAVRAPNRSITGQRVRKRRGGGWPASEKETGWRRLDTEEETQEKGEGERESGLCEIFQSPFAVLSFGGGGFGDF